MGKIVFRLILGILPIAYMVLIWMQSSHFNPESIYSLSSDVRIEILVLVGVCFELFHLFEFGILYFLLIMAFLSVGKLTKGAEVLAAVLSLSYGLVDEIHQMFVPFRSFSYGDLLKDAIGVLMIAYLIHRSYFSSKSSKLGLFLKKIERSFDRNDREIPF